ncbi:MAG: hypothetical protein LBH44_10440 [Treponema sp.]|jgi:hypothetical protein|nr:hypothetical protein [Treponema sp.]
MAKRNWHKTRTVIGNLLLDMGKLSFGGLMLGSILRGGFDPFQTFVLGGAVAIVLFVLGVIIISKNEE